MTGEQIKDIDKLQEDWERYKKQGRREKTASLELCVPFSVKYSLDERFVVKLAKKELTVSQVIKIFEKCKEKKSDKYNQSKGL